MKKNYKIKVCYLFLCLSIVISATSIICYQLTTQKIVEQIEKNNTLDIGKLIFVLLFFICLQIIFSYVQPVLEAIYRNKLLHDIRIRISSGILNKRIEEFTNEVRAKYISTLNNDIKMVVEDFYISGLNIFECTIFIVLSIGALLTINSTLAIILIVGNLLTFLNPLIFKNHLSKAKLGISESLSQYNLQLTDFMQGIPIIKTYLLENLMLKKIKTVSKNINKANYKYLNIFACANIVGVGVTAFQDFTILVIGILMIASGDLTIGALLATLQISTVVSQPVVTISYYINTRVSIKPLKKQIDELMHTQKHSGVSLHNKIETITIEGLGIERDDSSLIRNINYTFKKGMKYLIIGESGCGKSTLLNSIYNTYKLSEGSIYVNKINLRNIDEQDYYSQVKMLYQESYLFNDSIKENITFSLQYNEKYLNEILFKLQLHELNDSEKLSGGEKQRIALARALITQPQVLLVDEITASLDANMSRTVEELLLDSSMLIINVTHKPSLETLQKYDEIIIMNKGEINVSGSYKSLKELGFIA